MTAHYYNEWDKGAAAWLRELINNKLIPFGCVDERSITEVTPSDLEGFTQCHFFAGIGGWPLALKLAGVPASTRLWTGSPPCQPFSVAGQSLGFDDERHLAPAFLRLIRECQPDIIFGEQVAAAIGKHWLDFVFLNMEDKGYACGSAVLPACSVGAPHKRDRLFFGATLKLADSSGERVRVRPREGISAQGETESGEEERERFRTVVGAERADLPDRMAYSDDTRPQGWGGMPERANQQSAWATGVAGGMGDADGSEFSSRQLQRGGNKKRPEQSAQSMLSRGVNPHNGFWSDADWLGCRDGKFRPVEPGTFPLANGIPARVGRLRGYGNAIVPQVAAEFIKAFMRSV